MHSADARVQNCCNSKEQQQTMANRGRVASDTWLATLIVAAAKLLPAVMDAGVVSLFTIQPQS